MSGYLVLVHTSHICFPEESGQAVTSFPERTYLEAAEKLANQIITFLIV
jgi:hypothetical protein